MNARIEFPDQLAGSGIECNHFLAWRVGVKHAFDNDWIGLHPACLSGIERPRHAQGMHVLPVNLRECGVVVRRGVAVRNRPVVPCRFRCLPGLRAGNSEDG